MFKIGGDFLKLLTRIKISYFLAFICPVVLILATGSRCDEDGTELYGAEV